MNDTLARAQQKAIALAVKGDQRVKEGRATVIDTWVVTHAEDGIVHARPVHAEDAVPRKVNVLTGVRCLLGDEVLVVNIGGRWTVIGCIRSTQTGFSMLQATPIIVPSVKRTGDATWGATVPVEFSSLRATITDLDPGMTYLITARAGAYLTSASTATKVALGVRIGYPNDPDSVATDPYGPGHQLATPMWAAATFKRIVSSVTEMQVTVRGWASATGTHTLGDGQLDIDITPLYVAGRI